MMRKHGQRGATLLVALVMLVVLTLLVVSAIRASSANLRIAGNMQMQTEASVAAQQAIESVLSTNFTDAAYLAKNFPAGAASSVAVDINNDGTFDYTAAISQPSCTGSIPVLNSDPVIPAECVSSSTASNTGIMSASGAAVATAQSWCNAQQWDVGTRATSLSGSGASSNLHQGVYLYVPTGTACL